MEKIGWRFAPLFGGNIQGYSSIDIEAFKGEDLTSNLIKEACQNSLDAKDAMSSEPVEVVLTNRKIRITGYRVFDEYHYYLGRCEKFWNGNMDSMLGTFLSSAKDEIKAEDIPSLIISDYNTVGAPGSQTSDMEKMSTPWFAMTEADGYTSKTRANDGNLQMESGGGYGLGKNAHFAASALSMVFYNTKSRDDKRGGLVEEGFIGITRLATLYDEQNRKTQRIGHYQLYDEENEKFEPIHADTDDEFRKQFLRDKFGTDVIIVGFNQPGVFMEDATKAVLKNFFVAVKEGRLVVRINDEIQHTSCVIDADSIFQIFESYATDQKFKKEYQLWQAFINFTSKATTKILEDSEDDDLEVYLKMDDKYSRSIAKFRSNGMLVGLNVKHSPQHFSCVIIVRGAKLCSLLKKTEPPKHNKWDPKIIPVSNPLRKQTREIIEKIDKFVSDMLCAEKQDSCLEVLEADGMSECFYDLSDNGDNLSEGTDILRPKVKISDVIISPKPNGTVTECGIIAEGTPITGKVNNHETTDIEVKETKTTRVVIPDPDNSNPIKGATAGNGTKTLSVPNIEIFRGFFAKSGTYDIALKLKESCKVRIECFSVGEDGAKKPLFVENVIGFKNGVPYHVPYHTNAERKKSIIGPVWVDGETKYRIDVLFTNMNLNKVALAIVKLDE